MLKRVIKRIRLNFRTSQSDRSATNSYRNYHHHMRKIVYNKVSGLKNKFDYFIKQKSKGETLKK